MRLSRFRVRKFRNIIDTGEIDVDEAVTCLVGMNESGKTAVLSALHRLNPIDGESFDEQRDYPRWLLSKDRREGVIGDASPISATFELEPAERELLEAEPGKCPVHGLTLGVEDLWLQHDVNDDVAQSGVSWVQHGTSAGAGSDRSLSGPRSRYAARSPPGRRRTAREERPRPDRGPTGS